MRTPACLFTLVGLVSSACGNDEWRSADDGPERAGASLQLEHRILVNPGEEAWSCKVSTLPTTDWTHINAVDSVQNDSMHHMDLMAIQLAAPDLLPGEYDCNDVYARYPALMDNGITIYASQQAEQAVLLPPATSAMLPPATLVMHEIHFVNPTDEPVEAFSVLQAHVVSGDTIRDTIWGGAVRDLDIAIPASARGHIEWTRCVMTEDIDVLFLSSHTHALAERTIIRSFDGTTVGPVLYENTDWHAPPLQDMTATPMRVPAGAGFELECHYNNPTAEEVRWGFSAAEEMCQIALVYTPGESQRICEIVDSGVRQR